MNTRNSRSQMFFKLGVLKIVANFTKKHLFLIKFQKFKKFLRMSFLGDCFMQNQKITD